MAYSQDTLILEYFENINQLTEVIMTTISRTFSVCPSWVSLVEERLEKMNKKAIKLGIAPAVITEKFEYVVIDDNGIFIKRTPYTRITVEATEIKFGNYEFVATLDHTIGDKPVVKVVPNKSIPEQYQNADCSCDHCGIKRNRNETFIFKDDNGFKQVGRSCLKEFFGIDPTKTLDWFGSVFEMAEDGYFGGYSKYKESTIDVVATALAVVESEGYISKKTASEYNSKVVDGNIIYSTGSLVFQALNPPVPTKDNKDIIEWCRNIRIRANELDTEATDMIAWGIEYFSKQSGEYAHNMGIFLNTVSIEPKYIGYVVSVIGAWQRENVAKAEKETKRFDNEYVGNVGDKLTVDVSVVKIIPLEGQYGISYMNIMNQVDTANNIIWISSKSVLNEGDNITLKGTVKKLNDRDGKKQTFLTRCKVV